MTNSQEPAQAFVEPFVLAAHGNLDTVKLLLGENPALLNVAWQKFDETALQAASHMGRRDIAEFLLTAGAPLNLFTAAMLGMRDTVQAAIVSDPALACARGVHGFSLMYHAALSGDVDIAELLYSHGADDLGTALHAAVLKRHVPMARWLLEHGADTSAPNFAQKTPLQVALDTGHEDMAELLRARAASST